MDELRERVARAIARRVNGTPFDRLPWSEQRCYLETADDVLALPEMEALKLQPVRYLKP